MAAPVYTTDLSDIVLAESGETWSEPTGATGGGVPSAETDYYIQQSACFSKTMAIAGGGIGGMGTLAASSKTITSPQAVFVWIFFGCPNTLDSEANGGLRVIVGNTLANYKSWYVKGSDTYTYGGWINIAVDPSVTSQFDVGTPSGVFQYFGTVAKTLATISKGSPFGTDAIRFGRTLQVVNGDSGGYATFSGAAAKNDANDVTNGYNRWGLFQAIDGGYLMKGLFLLGTAGTPVDFRDSNKNISIQDTLRVVSGFNEFEIRNATSRVDWTNINISALGTTSRGNLTVTDNADVNIDTCTFTDMGIFNFQANSTILDSTFRRCNLITQSSATFTGCTFASTNDAVKAILSNNPSNISNCSFVSSGTGHAIELSNACAGNSYSFAGNTFTGYAATDGSTGNEAIYNNSGGAVTINLSSGDVPTIRNGTGASTTIATSITLEMVVKNESGAVIVGAYAYIDNNNTSPFIMNTTTNASGIASVAYSGSAVSGATWRVRKYGYKAFSQLIDISGANISLPVTLVADPLQV